MKVVSPLELNTYLSLFSEHERYTEGVLMVKEDKEADVSFWETREKLRLLFGVYKPILFSSEYNQELFETAIRGTNKYPHVSNTSPLLIAYTKDSNAGERDIQSPIKLGKFLTTLGTTASSIVNLLANDFLQMQGISNMKLIVTQDPREIASVYTTMSTRSCMSHKKLRWGLKMKFIAPSTDPEVERRAGEFKHALRQTTLLHPTMFYGLSPDLALAYYRSGERLQARTIVNIETKTYTRVYGNDFMHALLKKEGYTHDSRGPGNFRSAICVCSSRNTSESVALAPYIDGNEPVEAWLDINNGLIEAEYQTYSKRNELEEKNLYSLGTFRNYDLGGQRLLGEYDTLEDFKKHICPSCKRYGRVSVTAPYVRSNEAKCDDCVSHEIHELTSYTDVMAGLYIGNDSNRIMVDSIQNFVHVGNLLMNKHHLQYMNYPDYGNGIIADMAYGMSRKPYRGTVISLIEDAINDEVETGYYVHKSSLDNLDYDEEMNVVAPKAQFREAVMPHGVVRNTLQDTTALLGASGTYVLNKYGTTHIVKAKADEYQGDMELTLRLGSYYLKSTCITAYVDKYKREEQLPRQHLAYATSTRKWYLINSYSHVEELRNDLNPMKLMEEHGREIFEAKYIIYNYLPFTSYISWDLSGLWAGEIAATRRSVTVEEPPTVLQSEQEHDALTKAGE